MRLHYIKNYADKLFNSLQELEKAEQHTYYQKSKEVLNETARQCIESIKIILSILQETMMDIENNTDIDEGLEEPAQEEQGVTKREFNALTQEVEAINSYINPKQMQKLKGQTQMALMKDHPQELQIYTRYLKEVKEYRYEYEEAKICARVMCEWYEKRILTKYENSMPFNCDIRKIKEVLYAIVIYMGYVIENGLDIQTAVVNMFNEWYEKLKVDSRSCRWIAPYEIYEITQGKKDRYNLTAVVLWDILLGDEDAPLTRLCREEDKWELYPKCNEIWDRTSGADSSILDNYKNYNESPQIITDLGIV